MSKHPHIIIGITTISILILPVVFILGIMVPMIISDVLATYFGDYSTVFTTLGVIILIFLLIPPPDKKKRNIVSRCAKNIFHKFFRPKQTDVILIQDNITQFGAIEHLPTDSPQEAENTGDDLNIDALLTIQHPPRILQQHSTKTNIFQTTLAHLIKFKHQTKAILNIFLLNLKKLCKKTIFNFISRFFLKQDFLKSTHVDYSANGEELQSTGLKNFSTFFSKTKLNTKEMT